MSEYQRWLSQELDDKSLTEELKAIENQPEEINDRFYRNLEFGTGGLRGVIGAGTNRINVYTVRKATQGLASYLLKNSNGKPLSVAIAHDSRNKGVDFAKQAAAVLAANGIKAHLYTELMPTPALSFAVRHLKCDAGICITASHNPAKYNGYKAYGSDGCQVTAEMADGIMSEIQSLDIFEDVKKICFENGLKDGTIAYMDKSVADSFLDAVHAESLKGDASNIKVVYTPLNGAGKMCVLSILDKIGVKDVTVVPEQSEPDGNFPTCPYPNPEFREALQKGLDLSERVQPDLLLATDPDCDRVGIAVNKSGEFVLLSGNEVGVLLLDFIAKIKKEQNKMPANPVAVTTIVSTDMTHAVAKKFNIDLRRVLTGFKYIGDIIAELEENNRADDFIFGFEESYGYLSGGYVRDKDAVDASMLICEMTSYYKEKGITLYDAMQSLYEEYGYYLNETLNFTFEGEEGLNKMNSIMNTLRENPPKSIAGISVSGASDYERSICYENGETVIDLPKSNVLEYRLEGGNKFIVRPSGTEPKIKIYLSVNAPEKSQALSLLGKLKDDAEAVLGI